MNPLAYYIAFLGLHAIVNALLHDFFVLRKYKKFDRELIRLLIDGHILLFAGIFYFISVYGIAQSQTWAYYIAITTALFILGYCALIFKLLPSIVTIIISTAGLVWLVTAYLSL